MADETSNISGTEQLSIEIRFFDNDKRAIREEFLGFIELHSMDAVNIASAIGNCIQNEGLDGTKHVGQGYDGCATMAGKVNGVQTILRDKYPHALFFHCASHKLNLVVNDLNCVCTAKSSNYKNQIFRKLNFCVFVIFLIN
jgi:hypothetical protein